MSIRRKISIVVVLFLVAVGGLFYIYNQIYFSHGIESSSVMFSITKGEGNGEIATNLKEKKLISQKIYFWLYLKKHNLLDKIYPGEYPLNGNLTIPEIAAIITNPQKVFITVTFPEGWTTQQMADRLSANGFDGAAFLELVNNPSEDILSQFSILTKKPKGVTLEGYLFPDTYKFSKEATPDGILKKILNNTELKITDEIRKEASDQNKSIFQILTMASILEKEVSTVNDFKIVSGIFWKRIAIGQALQSDATLEYVLKTNVLQHSVAETKTDSPYNTYMYKGLPPGPISNPGINTILAALNPTDTDYNYFLTDPKNKSNTVYAKTYAEHVANKQKFGL
jgi:UPF0755 protein